MKIYIGDEFAIDLKVKLAWVRDNFKKEQYKIIVDGFLIDEYYLEFTEERYATLFRLHWG